MSRSNASRRAVAPAIVIMVIVGGLALPASATHNTNNCGPSWAPFRLVHADDYGGAYPAKDIACMGFVDERDDTGNVVFSFYVHSLVWPSDPVVYYDLYFTPDFGSVAGQEQHIRVTWDGSQFDSFWGLPAPNQMQPDPTRTVDAGNFGYDILLIYFDPDQLGTPPNGSGFYDIKAYVSHCDVAPPCVETLDDTVPDSGSPLFVRLWDAPRSTGEPVPLTGDPWEETHDHAADISLIGAGDTPTSLHLFLWTRDLTAWTTQFAVEVAFNASWGLRSSYVLQANVTSATTVTDAKLYLVAGPDRVLVDDAVPATVGPYLEDYFGEPTPGIRFGLDRVDLALPQAGDYVWDLFFRTKTPAGVLLDQSEAYTSYPPAGNSYTFGTKVPDFTRPTAPGAITATPQPGGDVEVSWVAATDNFAIDHYHVFRVKDAASANCWWVDPCDLVAVVPDATFVDTDTWDGATYHYVVIASDPSGNPSPVGPVGSATATGGPIDLTPPGPIEIANLAATPNGQRVTGNTYYHDDAESGIAWRSVHRSTTTGFTPDASNRIALFEAYDGFTFSDQSVVEDTTYYYKAVACNNAGLCTTSVQASVTTTRDHVPPGPVTNFTVTNEGDRIQLRWDPAAETDVRRWNIYLEGAGGASTAYNNPRYAFVDFWSNETKCYAVAALDNADNEGPLTDYLCAKQNWAPTIAAVGPIAATEGSPVTFDVTASDRDASQGDAATLQMPTGLPAGMSASRLSATSVRVSWTPNFDQAGPHDILFTATDLAGGVGERTIRVDVADRDLDPVFAPQSPRTALETVPMSLVVSATDPEGRAVSFTASGVPSTATFTDHANGTATFAWTPPAGSAGPYSVLVTADDGTRTAEQTLSITVRPLAGLDLASLGPSTIFTSPHASVDFQAVVTNTGPNTDTFRFTSTNTGGWGVNVPADVTLAPGENATVTLRLFVPGDRVSTTVSLRATSLGNPAESRAVAWFAHIPLVVTVQPDQPTVTPPATPKGVVVVKYLDGSPAVGASVTLRQTPTALGPSFATTLTGTTDTNGRFAYDFGPDPRANAPGGHTLSAQARDAFSRSGAGTASYAVS